MVRRRVSLYGDSQPVELAGACGRRRTPGGPVLIEVGRRALAATRLHALAEDSGDPSRRKAWYDPGIILGFRHAPPATLNACAGLRPYTVSRRQRHYVDGPPISNSVCGSLGSSSVGGRA